MSRTKMSAAEPRRPTLAPTEVLGTHSDDGPYLHVAPDIKEKKVRNAVTHIERFEKTAVRHAKDAQTKFEMAAEVIEELGG